MGLDMYVYQAKKPVGLKTGVIYNYDELRDKGLAMFEADDVENEKWFADLMPFCVKVRCEAQYYDIATIAEKFDLGERAHWCGFGPEGIYFRGEKREITISDEEVEQYCITKEKDWYAVHTKEVAYWRKHYELQTELYNAYELKDKFVENCGYYVIDDEILEIINDMSETKFGLGRYKKGTLLYHEWY